MALMKTRIIEVTNGFNYGKFLIGRLDIEWLLPSQLPLPDDIAPSTRPLLAQLGQRPDDILFLDLQTGEGALLFPVGDADSDLRKHRVWLCPLAAPLARKLYTMNLDDLDALPAVIELTEEEAPSEWAGYRREGPTRKLVLDTVLASLIESGTEGSVAILDAAGAIADRLIEAGLIR